MPAPHLSPWLCDASALTFTLFSTPVTAQQPQSHTESARFAAPTANASLPTGCTTTERRAGALPSCPRRGAEQPSAAGRLPVPRVPSLPGHSFGSVLAEGKSWLPPTPLQGVNAAGAAEWLPAPALWLRLPSADLGGRESSSPQVLPPTQVMLGSVQVILSRLYREETEAQRHQEEGGPATAWKESSGTL